MLPEGAIDVHVHASPSLWERKGDAVEFAAEARNAGLGGLVLKSHFGSTVTHAFYATREVPDFDCYSSLTLNSFVGGFNPTAVELAIETGASVIWMPTFTAENYKTNRYFPFSNQSLTALDSNGMLKSNVTSVIDTIADADRSIVLGNGHLGRDETFAILDYLESHTYEIPFAITHADSSFMGLSIADQIELAERGAYIEKCYLSILSGYLSIEDMTESIAEIGADRCVLSTDHGQPDNLSPADAFHEFAELLAEHGVSSNEIETMSRTNPRMLLTEDP